MDALLALEDGSVFAGRAFGASAASAGEVVFNTSMAGYQEILSDPSYAGQIVVMTCPEIGNYGVNALDMESRKVWARGFVVRELSEDYSSWRANRSLAQLCKEQGIAGISEVDTRALTRKLRSRGVMRGFVAHLTHRGPTPEECVKRAREAPQMLGADLVTEVTTREPYCWTEAGEWTLPGGALPTAADGPSVSRRFKVAALDFGIKLNILRALRDVGCDVTVLPATANAKEVLALRPDGVFLSNGPGDPAAVTYGIATVKNLMGERPIFGICLGHQILGIALGGRTFKLPFGHRGGNHPVKDLDTGRIEITAQNHGFAVDPASLDSSLVEVTHVNLNDGTVEGLRHKKLPVYSVQYHPESSPGPHDARHLFRRFVRAMSDGA